MSNNSNDSQRMITRTYPGTKIEGSAFLNYSIKASTGTVTLSLSDGTVIATSNNIIGKVDLSQYDGTIIGLVVKYSVPANYTYHSVTLNKLELTKS